MIIHVVSSGETLSSISRAYGVTVNQIAYANGLSNPDRLVVGEALVIPETEPDTYVVKPGDTLWSIAAKFNTTIGALIQANQLTNPDQLVPGQVLNIAKPIVDVNGYMPETGSQAASIISAIGYFLTYMCTFSYKVLADGSLVTLDDASLIAAANSRRVVPLMTITNTVGRSFNSELAHAILSSTQVQDTLLANIINTMNAKGYRGLNIDFEYVFPSDREPYNRFLARTVNRLHPLGFSVSTALAPKISGNQPGLLYEAHDYPVHGRLADFVVLMTYEWGWAGGPPLAIAPVNEVRRVLDYAVTAIPRNKILMGMPTYGRDWKLPFVRGTTLAATISPPQALDLAYRYNAAIQYNILYQSPFFYYTDDQGASHVVWFEDARSVQAKYNLVKEYGLRGVSYWELSTEFPQNWPVLAGNFTTRKLV